MSEFLRYFFVYSLLFIKRSRTCCYLILVVI
nr:MAG TPA: hypothetical protein [Caudoviricetes sp.]